MHFRPFCLNSASTPQMCRSFLLGLMIKPSAGSSLTIGSSNDKLHDCRAMLCAAVRLQSSNRPWCVQEANPKHLICSIQEGDSFAIRSSRNVEIHCAIVVGRSGSGLVRFRSRSTQRFKSAGFSSNAAKPWRFQGCASGLLSARAAGQPDPGRIPNQLAASSGNQLG